MTEQHSTIDAGHTWVVVADTSEAIIYRRNKRHSALERVDSLRDPTASLHQRDLVTDKQGRAFDRSGRGRHTIDADFDPRDEAHHRFAKRIAERIDAGRQVGAFTRLVLIAPPAMLAQLRDHLSHETASLLVQSSAKRLTGRSAEVIMEHIDW
jgi:protein required for attachment to host cells